RSDEPGRSTFPRSTARCCGGLERSRRHRPVSDRAPPCVTCWLRCTSIRCMRTTLSLDDDVLLAVKERARRENRTAGEVLSDLARQALTGQLAPAEVDRAGESFHGFDPLPHRGGAVSNALIDRLRDKETA